MLFLIKKQHNDNKRHDYRSQDGRETKTDYNYHTHGTDAGLKHNDDIYKSFVYNQYNDNIHQDI